MPVVNIFVIILQSQCLTIMASWAEFIFLHDVTWHFAKGAEISGLSIYQDSSCHPSFSTTHLHVTTERLVLNLHSFGSDSFGIKIWINKCLKQASSSLVASQDVHQSGLSSPWGAHDPNQFLAPEPSRERLK